MIFGACVPAIVPRPVASCASLIGARVFPLSVGCSGCSSSAKASHALAVHGLRFGCACCSATHGQGNSEASVASFNSTRSTSGASRLFGLRSFGSASPRIYWRYGI